MIRQARHQTSTYELTPNSCTVDPIQELRNEKSGFVAIPRQEGKGVIIPLAV